MARIIKNIMNNIPATHQSSTKNQSREISPPEYNHEDFIKKAFEFFQILETKEIDEEPKTTAFITCFLNAGHLYSSQNNPTNWVHISKKMEKKSGIDYGIVIQTQEDKYLVVFAQAKNMFTKNTIDTTQDSFPPEGDREINNQLKILADILKEEINIDQINKQEKTERLINEIQSSMSKINKNTTTLSFDDVKNNKISIQEIKDSKPEIHMDKNGNYNLAIFTKKEISSLCNLVVSTSARVDALYHKIDPDYQSNDKYPSYQLFRFSTFKRKILSSISNHGHNENIHFIYSAWPRHDNTPSLYFDLDTAVNSGAVASQKIPEKNHLREIFLPGPQKGGGDGIPAELAHNIIEEAKKELPAIIVIGNANCSLLNIINNKINNFTANAPANKEQVVKAIEVKKDKKDKKDKFSTH